MIRRTLLTAGLLWLATLFPALAEDREKGLRFSAVVTESGPDTQTLRLKESNEELHISNEVIIGREHLKSSEIKNEADSATVILTFTDEGSKKFAEASQKVLGQRIAILVDGQLLSAPFVSAPITEGVVVISGNFNLQEAAHIQDRIAGRK